MTQSQQNYMGEFLKEKPKLTTHSVLNYFVSRPATFKPKFQLQDGTAFIAREIQFPDVSFYQKEIDYDIMATKTQAIILRAGQGAWPDIQFERNYREAKTRGLLVGVYWFYDGRTSPADQAELLVSLLQGKKLELGVYIDWEHNYGGRWEGLPNVVAMMQLVDELLSFDVTDNLGLYTGYYFFRANSNPITHASQYSYLKSKLLWLAWYTNDVGLVRIPAPWTIITHWQWGTPTVYWGQATAEIDMNFFNGTKEEFYLRYGGANPPTNGDSMQIIKGTVKQTVFLRIGSASAYPNASVDGRNYLTVGQIIEADRNEAQWLHITKIGDRVVTGSVWASAGSSEQYIGWDWVTIPDEPPPPEPEPPTLKHTISIQIMTDGSFSITVDGNPYP